MRKVDHINFTRKRDPELLAKLNAVAPYQYRKVHELARAILLRYLDEQIRELGITVDFQQPPSVGG